MRGMRRWLFALLPAGSAVLVLASCEGTDGLSGGGDSTDAALEGSVGSDAPSAEDGGGEDAGCVVPTPDPGYLSDAVEIDTSGRFVCAVRVNGQVVCWGDNDSGQLGVAGPDAGSQTPLASSPRP